VLIGKLGRNLYIWVSSEIWRPFSGGCPFARTLDRDLFPESLPPKLLNSYQGPVRCALFSLFSSCWRGGIVQDSHTDAIACPASHELVNGKGR
jgi:hypothetical protein